MSKLLQGVGVLALLLWTGAGAGAWMLTKEGVQVTLVEGGSAARVSDRSDELLCDQVSALQKDVQALAHGMAGSLEQMARELDGSGERRITGLSNEIRELRGIAERSETECERLAASLECLENRMTRESPSASPMGRGSRSPIDSQSPIATAAGGSGTTIAATPAPETSVAEDLQPARSSAAAAPEDPVARKHHSFLAFELPSEQYAFDREMHWTVIPSLSRVGFDAKSTLHDFTGVTSKVEGHLDGALADLSHGAKASVMVVSDTLDTGLEDRNSAMYEHLATAEHPRIEFTLQAFETATTNAAEDRVEGTARGTMRIRGKERELAMPVSLRVDRSRRLTIEGESSLRLSDYEVPIPSKLGLISMQDEVKIWISLRLRGASKEKP